MKIIRILPLLFLICTVCCGQSKRNNNWAFGDSVGLNFNTTIPTVDTNYVLYTKETSSSISDSSGNLLFYASSPGGLLTINYYELNVWNNQMQVMPNGDSLIGQSTVTQGTLILPAVHDTNMYYIFTIGKISGPGPNYLYYSIVDMQLDSGRGDVTVKNVPLTNFNLSEKMTVVKHGNGRDWWLITHDMGINFAFFLITPTGISGPYLQAIGASIYNTIGNARYAGQMCVSPDGNKLCLVGMEKVIDLYDLDRCSGMLNNYICVGDTNFSNQNRGAYGCSFSPNSSVLYVSTMDTLFQYDLTAPNIASSAITLFSVNCADTCLKGQHMIAPNGYIYVGNGSSSMFGTSNVYNTNISYIENPNVIGLGCGFNHLGLYLNGRESLGSLPNLANYDLGRDSGSVCDSLTGIPHLNPPRGGGLTVVPNPARDETVVSSGVLIKHVAVLNSRGKTIFETQASVMSIKINTADFANGVYVIKAETAEGVTVKKLVVLRR